MIGRSGTTRGSIGRSIVAGIVGVLAVIGVTVGVVGVWAIRVATDSERFEHQVTDLLQEQDVSDALAERVMNEVVAAVPVRDAVLDIVPGVLEPAADAILAGAAARVEDRLAETIRSPEYAAAVGAAAGRAHALVVGVIEGEPLVDGVRIEGGEVRVNLLPLTARAITLFQEVGLFRQVVVPDLGPGGDPASQRAELSAALGRDLPPEFGEPVLFRSEALDRLGTNVQLVRDLLVFAKRSAWLLVIAGAVLGSVAIWISAVRWRSASFLVAGVLASALIVRVAVRRAGDRLPGTVGQPGAKTTIAELVGDLERSLERVMFWYCAAAIAALVLAAIVAARRAHDA